jgi:hypothetical protein
VTLVRLSRIRLRIAGLAALTAGVLVLAATAQANAPIVTYSAQPSTTQAGGHPDVEVYFAVRNRISQQSQSACNCEDAKDATVHLPEGFIGNPGAMPKCSIADFSANHCPIDSQTGIVEVGSGGSQFVSAIYNVEPPPDVAGLIAFKIVVFDTPQFTVLSGRTDSDYGLDAKATSIFHGLAFPLESFREVLWGVPADPIHDPLRLDTRFTPNGGGRTAYAGELCDINGQKSTEDPSTVYKPCIANIPPASSNSPLTPFLQNPTTCDAPLESSIDVLSYDGGSDHAAQTWPQGTGCNQLSFNPSLYAQPTTTSTESASGIDANLSVPQPLSPTIPSPSELKAATVTLPPGFAINPNAADGKIACTDAEANFGTRIAAECPDFSKVGSVEIDSSALPGPLPGFVYLGQPLPGNRYRIFLVADGFATHVKLAGTVTPDPQTGQLTISFENLPQSPLTAFNLHFFGSERGTLVTPTRCGTYPVTSTFTPWDSRLSPQTSTQYFTLDSGPGGTACPNGARSFHPGFSALSAGNTAGSRTPFSVDLSRDDGEQNVAGLTVKTPPGFSASLQGIPYCPEAAIAQLHSIVYSGIAELANSVCPAASQIGTAMAAAGAGTHPVYVPGKVYLAGPYKGAPLSLLVVVPAVSGPYDLGNVAIRAAIRVDPLTAQVTTTSDPIPQILEGIPLRARRFRVDLNRPDFTINPTNCDAQSVTADMSGDEGGSSQANALYQVANCASLPFEPDLSLEVRGGLNRRGHPAVHAVLTSKPGESNSRRISVTLPKGELLDNAHIGTVCVKPAFAAGTCPEDSRIGHAEVTTPLLDHPLEGNVYLRSSTHTLPDIVLDLKGQISIEAVGRISSVKARLRSIFETVPDVPVSRIVLDLVGGQKGLLVNSEGLCGTSKNATVEMTGQNGAVLERKTEVKANCGSRSRTRRHSSHRKSRQHSTRGRAGRQR